MYLILASSAERTLLDCLVLEIRVEGRNSGSHGTVNSEIVLGRLPPPGHGTDSKLTPPPQPPSPAFLWKKPICLSKSFGLRSRLLVWHTTRRLWRCFQGKEAGRHNICALLMPCSSLPVSPSKKSVLYFLIWHPNVCGTLNYREVLKIR